MTLATRRPRLRTPAPSAWGWAGKWQGILKGRRSAPIGPDMTIVAWDDTANARRLHDRILTIDAARRALRSARARRR